MLESDVEVYEHARLTLRRLMTERGVTQTAMAKVLGCSQGHLNDRLGGKVRLNLRDIARAARHFQVEVATFFSGGSGSVWIREIARRWLFLEPVAYLTAA